MNQTALILLLLTAFVFGCGDQANKDGKIETYYDSGSLSRIAYYKDGMLNGEEKTFYPSGVLKTKKQWKNDTLIYEQHEYYDTLVSYLRTDAKGDTIISESPSFKSYSFVNNEGKVAYKVDYDTKANIAQKNGNSIVLAFKEVSTGRVGEHYDIAYIVATPPLMEARQMNVLVYNENQLIDSAQLEIDYDYNRATFSFTPKATGMHEIKSIYKQVGAGGEFEDTNLLNIMIK